MGQPKSTDRELRRQVLENLLHRVREEQFPSPTMLDVIEGVLHDDEIEEYAAVLFAKVRDETYPSMDIVRRLYSFV